MVKSENKVSELVAFTISKLNRTKWTIDRACRIVEYLQPKF